VVVGVLVAILLLVLWVSAHVHAARESAARERLSCQLKVWTEKSGEIERRLREANPQLTAREVQAQLKRERPFVMANAKIACDGRAN
jgi:hypothetical protein